MKKKITLLVLALMGALTMNAQNGRLPAEVTEPGCKGALPELIDLVANDIKPLGREKQKEFLEYGLNIFHNSLLFNNNMSDEVMLPADEKNFAKNFAPFVNTKNAAAICELFEESINQIERNANASIVFMDDSCKMSKLLRIK